MTPKDKRIMEIRSAALKRTAGFSKSYSFCEDNNLSFMEGALWADSHPQIDIDLIKQVCKYCEDNAIYDKLGNYGDFYYKFKKLLEE